MTLRSVRTATLAVVLAVVAAVGGSSSAVAADPDSDLGALGWVWPVRPVLIERVYVAPAHEYGPGHRGIDLRPTIDDDVRAPAAGTVAYVGSVAGRGILTIDHGSGLVTTFEPVVTELVVGAGVAGGEVVASLDAGGHASPGTVHFGVRLDGDYINPMLLLGGVPRAVLLPCCD